MNTITTRKVSIILLLLSANLPLSANFFNSLSQFFASLAQPNHHHVTYEPATTSTSEMSTGMLSESQARSYIEQILAAFDHGLQQHASSGTLSRMKRFIVRTICQDRTAYEVTPTGKLYLKIAIDDRINSAIVAYIEHKSYQYAYKITHNEKIANKIAGSMRDNAIAKISQVSYLDAETLAPFVGHALRRAVRDYVHTLISSNTPAPAPAPSSAETSSHNTAQPAHYYPSEDCCVCFQELITDVNRVFLYPCGHDICTDCATAWFNATKRTCPICRATIDIDLLYAAIASMQK